MEQRNIPASRPGRDWYIGAALTRALALFLLIDTTFTLSDQLGQTMHGAASGLSRAPTLYLGIQELLVSASPRATVYLPVVVFFLRVTSTVVAVGMVTGAAVRFASQGRWRIRTRELLILLVSAAIIGLIGAAMVLVLVGAN